MCELYFQYSRNGSISSKTLTKLLTEAIGKGACRNSDGFGIFNEKGDIFKADETLDWKHYNTIHTMFSDSKWIVLHLRMATHGSVKKKNAHPFEHEGNILAHNGVTTPPKEFERDRPDSYHILREIHRQKDGDTVKAIKSAMKETQGSASIFLRDFKGKLYYFRDGKPFTFAFKEDTNEIVGATVKRRLTEMEDDEEKTLDFFHDKVMKEPEEGKIYKIDDSGLHVTNTFDMPDRFSYSGGTGSIYSNRRRRQRRMRKWESDEDSSDEECETNWERYPDGYMEADDDTSKSEEDLSALFDGE